LENITLILERLLPMQDKNERLPQYLIRLCSDKAAFEVKFSQRLRLNMETVKKVFETSEHCEIMLYTPHIIILKHKTGAEVTFSREGRILIKKVSDKEEAEKVTKSILREVVKKAPF
jgi:hypothetical protein